MLGLFQADLPIGHRLWIILLTLVVSGALSNGKVSFSSEPISFVTDTLLFFGAVQVTSAFIAMIPGTAFKWIERIFERSQEKSDPYRNAVGAYHHEWWFNPLANVAFVVAIIIMVPSFGTNQVFQLGIFGVGVLLLNELFDLEDIFYIKKTELLELELRESGRIHARLFVSGEQEYQFTVSSGWLSEINHLLSDGWTVLESVNTFQPLKAILTRSILVPWEFRKRHERRQKSGPPQAYFSREKRRSRN